MSQPPSETSAGMPAYRPLSLQAKDELRRTLGEDCLRDDPTSLEEYAQDHSGVTHRPELVVLPTEPRQVQQLMRLANRHRFPVTPRGAGTGMAGGCVASLGGVVLSLERMTRIRNLDTRHLVAEVEAGVITKTLKDAAREKGLFYPPDPASLDSGTLGGNAATNAGGPTCLKYGTTKDYVLGLEVVLPDGELINTGAATRKGVVGYDLTHLLVGSEGTLGVITALTLKLLPHPPAVAGLVAVFPDLERATECVTQIMVGGNLPSALEFMDSRCLELIADLLPFARPPADSALLYIEADGHPREIRRQMEAISQICRRMGASELMEMPGDEDRQRFWQARRQMTLRIREASALKLSEDVAVPIGHIAEMVSGLPQVAREHGIKIYSYGHSGDGNIHVNFTAGDTALRPAVEKAIRQVLERVLELGGTISGEHGIGLAKAPYLPMEIPRRSIELQMGIKRLFDPGLVLNPGKIFPWRPAGDASSHG